MMHLSSKKRTGHSPPDRIKNENAQPGASYEFRRLKPETAKSYRNGGRSLIGY
jgi:hypothetical protein